MPALDDELAKKLGFDDLAAMRETVTQPHPARIRPARPAAAEAAVAGRAGRTWRRSPRPRAWWSRSSTRSGSASRPTGRRAGWTRTTRTRTRTTLKAEYRAIAERRVRLGLLLAEIGRANSITSAPGRDDPGDAGRGDALPGPGAAGDGILPARTRRPPRRLRGPLFEDKVVDFMLELAKVDGEDGHRRRNWPSEPDAGEPPASDRRRSGQPEARLGPLDRPQPPRDLPASGGEICLSDRSRLTGWSPGRFRLSIRLTPT